MDRREHRAYREAPHVELAFPARRIISPLYVGNEGFRQIPKPDPWRAFFVSRDPRDIVVSWYFSTVSSHPTNSSPGMRAARIELARMSKEDGLIESVQRLGEFGLFDALGGWVELGDPRVLLIRYEDLIDTNDTGRWVDLLEHCDIALTSGELAELLTRNSFYALTGRLPGQEDAGSKLRKGVAGDWRSHFTPRVEAAFREETSDLVERLGYDPA